MTTQKSKKELLDISEYESAVSIVSSLDLESIMLKKKRWQAKIYVNEILPRSYRGYKIVLSLDEEPYLKRMEELTKSLDDTLFREDGGMKSSNNKKITEIRTQLETLRSECETIEFLSIVEELKYKNSSTLMTIRLPDDVIEPFNRQKMRLDIYKITLIPQ